VLEHPPTIGSVAGSVVDTGVGCGVGARTVGTIGTGVDVSEDSVVRVFVDVLRVVLVLVDVDVYVVEVDLVLVVVVVVVVVGAPVVVVAALVVSSVAKLLHSSSFSAIPIRGSHSGSDPGGSASQ
jgi:hypothetical protein